jgi:hypothetical protein
MTSQSRYLTQADADGVQVKLQALYETMPAEEQKIMQTLLELAARDADVQGFESPCCAIHFSLAPGMPGGAVNVTLPQMAIG